VTRNQGQCGQCWTFGTAENIRFQYMAAGNADPGPLSTQFINDCMHQSKTCGSSGVKGCCGGDPHAAMEWIKTNGGIPTAADYGDFDLTGVTGATTAASGGGSVVSSSNGPTKSGNNQEQVFTCKKNVPLKVAVTKTRVLDADESAMEKFVCNSGPITIALATEGWNTYKGGVLKATTCGTSVDHAVVLVGVNKEKNAWIVRNQWGKDWGVHASGEAPDGTGAFQYCHLLRSTDHNYKCTDSAFWTSISGMTWADFCPESCAKSDAELKEGSGYIFLQFAENTCGLTNAPVIPTVTEAAAGATTWNVQPSS